MDKLSDNYEIVIEPHRGEQRRLYIMTKNGHVEHEWNEEKRRYVPTR